MEALTRLFLVRAPAVLGPPSSSRCGIPAELQIDGTLDFAVDEERFAACIPTLERLAGRNPAAIVSSTSERSLRASKVLAERSNAKVELESDLQPRFLGSWQSARPSTLGPEWGSFLADRRTGAPEDSEPLEATGTRVLAVLDRIASNFSQREVVVVLHADGIRAALARALNITDGNVFVPEPGQAIALDWAHPQALEFQHAVIGMGFDWDVAPTSNKVHRFPGGASVLPRSS